MSQTVTRVICKRHGFSATVGRNVQFALDYYECPTCVQEQDAEYEESQRPCCSAANTTCCGHDDDYDFGPQFSVTIYSPNYCDHRESPLTCWNDNCGHEGCGEVPF